MLEAGLFHVQPRLGLGPQRALERAEMTCRLLNVRYAQLVANPETSFHDWVGVLKCASAFEAYRKSYRATMDPAHVVEFLLLGQDFP